MILLVGRPRMFGFELTEWENLANSPVGTKPVIKDDLASVRLSIGDMLQLQDVSAPNQRYYVKLIGYLQRRSVLVSHPMQDENLLFLKEGHGFLVRGFSGREAYEFKANIVSVHWKPYPYLHLSFPRQITTVNMRGALRIKLRLPCSVESGDAASKFSSTIYDMSTSGLRIHSETSLGDVGDKITVAFALPYDGDETSLSVTAVIRNVCIDEDGPGGKKCILHGLAFVSLNAPDRIALENFIYKSIAEH